MVLIERGVARNLSRTLMLVAVLVTSHLCAHGFAAALRSHFPLTDAAESDENNVVYGGSIDYGSIDSLIGRNIIRVRVPAELLSVRSDYDESGDLAFDAVKRTKDGEDLDPRIRLLLRLYSSIGNEVDPKTQRMFVGKRKRNTYATDLDRTPDDCASSSYGTR